MGKEFWKSKTLWVNVLVAIGSIFGLEQLNVDFSEEIIVSALAAVNVVLRLLTKEPVKLK